MGGVSSDKARPSRICEAASRSPVHAYLLVGPRGSGKRALADAFAAALLSAGSEGDDRDRHVRLALAEQHPDLVVIERVGASISADQAREVRDLASRSPIEGDRKVLILDEFHLVQETVGPILLKTIEEPPPGTIFIVLVDDVPPELVTIESRCVRIDLGRFLRTPSAIVSSSKVSMMSAPLMQRPPRQVICGGRAFSPPMSGWRCGAMRGRRHRCASTVRATPLSASSTTCSL